AMAIAFCTGNFPQLVRDLHALLNANDLAALRPSVGRPLSVASLPDWVAQTKRKKDFWQTLLALGMLRLARQFDSAVELMKAYQTQVPTEWRAAWANEQAALAWHRGRPDEAASHWRSQAESAPVLFNRGMAALFLGQPAEARPWLQQAVD